MDATEVRPGQNPLGSEKNFPPLPACCCVGPCFYHDISVDIPVENQKTCKIMFYLWQFYVFCLFFNCVAGLAALCVGYDKTFGIAFIYLIFFPGCSFVGWYRPIYKALKTDSSFQYMLFFFVFFAQIVLTVIYAVGISAVGTCGWFNAIAFATGEYKSKDAVAALFFVSAVLFTLLGIFEILLLKRLHTAYRRSGATMQKAQGEFAGSVISSAVQQPSVVNASNSAPPPPPCAKPGYAPSPFK